MLRLRGTAASPPAAEIPARGRVAEVPVRELRNRTRDVGEVIAAARERDRADPAADPMAAPWR